MNIWLHTWITERLEVAMVNIDRCTAPVKLKEKYTDLQNSCLIQIHGEINAKTFTVLFIIVNYNR